ncbi:MAG: hypothetical protein L0Y58_03255 [Verrucomicrobia subdivision 3 bacterium]|nr:hypothetical protein [Limisphaerales bacterium]
MKIPVADWRVTAITLIVCGVLSVKVAHSVTEKRMDALLKQQELSMEREARIWLELIEAIERGEPAGLHWLYARGSLAVMLYRKQAEREPWAQNPALLQRIKSYDRRRKDNPGHVVTGLEKLGPGPWMPESSGKTDK